MIGFIQTFITEYASYLMLMSIMLFYGYQLADRWTTIGIPIRESTKKRLTEAKANLDDNTWDELMERLAEHMELQANIDKGKEVPNLMALNIFPLPVDSG